jgi:hypothetical protein
MSVRAPRRNLSTRRVYKIKHPTKSRTRKENAEVYRVKDIEKGF